MHPELERIDGVFRPFENYYIRHADEFYRMTEEEQVEYLSGSTAQQYFLSDAQRREGQKLKMLLPQLSPEEIALGYERAGRILKQFIGGWMRRDFRRVYIPTMTAAIEEDHDGGYHFLAAMERNLDRQEFVSILLLALKANAPRILDTALAYVENMVVVEAIPLVRELANSPTPNLAKEAKQILRVLESANE